MYHYVIYKIFYYIRYVQDWWNWGWTNALPDIAAVSAQEHMCMHIWLCVCTKTSEKCVQCACVWYFWLQLCTFFGLCFLSFDDVVIKNLWGGIQCHWHHHNFENENWAHTKKFASAGGFKVLIKCTHACNVRSAKFLDVQVCLRVAKILRNSPPYFQTSASPVSMQKVIVLIL